MQEIRNTSGSTGNSGGEGQDSIDRESNGLQKNPFRLIHAANKKVRLYSVFKAYNINIPRVSKNQTWSATITCPLPSHKGARERTPSFGYNFIEDRFQCFGCHKSGRAVEFISEMEGKKRNSVAQSIIDYYETDVDDEPIVEQEDPRVENLLFSCSESIRKFYLNCKE